MVSQAELRGREACLKYTQEKETSLGNHINLNSQRDILPKPQVMEFHLVFTHQFHHLLSKLCV